MEKLIGLAAVVVGVAAPINTSTITQGAASQTDADLLLTSISLLKIALVVLGASLLLKSMYPSNMLHSLALLIGSSTILSAVICWLTSKGDKSKEAQTSYFMLLGIGILALLFLIYMKFILSKGYLSKIKNLGGRLYDKFKSRMSRRSPSSSYSNYPEDYNFDDIPEFTGSPLKF